MGAIQRLTFVTLSLYLCGQGLTFGQTQWPQFRGPGSRGVAATAPIPDRWSTTDNIAWKCDIPGRGWSSPIVWDNRVFLTTVINTGTSEEPKKGLYFGGNRPAPPNSEHQWTVMCLDLHSGKVLWNKLLHTGKPQTPIHVKSSFAAETPVTDGERVYCCFGSVGIYCLDFDGNELWQHKLEPFPTRYGWGNAASPVLHRDTLYYCNDNDQESYLLALDAKTGKERWKVARQEKSNWATPFIWENEQRTEIITPGSGAVRSYDLDGNLRWSLRGMSSITIATPFTAHGLLYVSSGYVGDQQRPIYAIKPGASGDISLEGENTTNEFIAWSLPKAAPYNPTTLVSGNRLYVLYDRGLIACFDALTGQELFAPKRLPDGQAFTSSPWANQGKIFCLNENGVTYVLNDSDQFELLHTNQLAEDDMGMATPAIVGDRLLLRTSARLYCIQSKP